jgi:hypothetical protein
MDGTILNTLPTHGASHLAAPEEGDPPMTRRLGRQRRHPDVRGRGAPRDP